MSKPNDTVTSDDRFTCGRRCEQGLDAVDSPLVMAGKNLDSWDASGNCTFCGSINPDALLAAIESGEVMIGATDKNYKIYVGGGGLSGKFYFQHFYDYRFGTGQLIREYADRFMKAWRGNLFKFQGGIEFYCKPMFLA